MIVGQAAVKILIAEFFDAFRAQLSARAVKVGPCRRQVTTLSDKPTYRQLHVDIGDDLKADAIGLADAVADAACGRCISFSLLALPRGVVAANRIDENEISIRMLAAYDVAETLMLVRADVLFAVRGNHEEEREESSRDEENLGRNLAEGTS
jgi:hypothetical protein